MDILTKMLSIIYGAWEALRALGVNVSAQSRSSLAQTISALILRDGFEQTPELRRFPDISKNLPSNTVKILRLKGGNNASSIAILLPVGSSGTIDWGDGTIEALTASASIQTYSHSWSTWQTSSDGADNYTIITISGPVTSIAGVAGTNAAMYWCHALWLAVKSSALTSIQLSNISTNNIYAYALRRVDMDTPNCLLPQGAFSQAPIRTWSFNGGYATDNSQYLFYQIATDEFSYVNSAARVVTALFREARCRKLTLVVSTAVAIVASSLCQACKMLRYFSINTAWGNFANAFNNCSLLKELDFSSCPVNGITDFTGNINMYALQKLLFPSTGAGASRAPKPFATGITSMGAIDISNSGLSRDALIEMFRSLPVNASSRNLTITGSVGASDLTAEDIAIVTSKNWVLIRA